jgi:predicted small lipoprotein YifL
MLKLLRSILDSQRVAGLALALSAVVLGACGQKGPLFLPSGPAAANRATLPETLRPAGTTTAPAPTSPASAPTR